MNCGATVKNKGESPVCKCGEEDPLNFNPEYPASRVTGQTYRPYTEFTVWDKRANACMKAQANDNFRKGVV